MRENRRLQRFDLALPARIETMQAELKGSEIRELLTGNVSAGGAFFHTEQPLPAGTQVKIDLILPLDRLKKLDGKQAYIMVAGKVIRSDESGMAIQFDGRYKIRPL